MSKVADRSGEDLALDALAWQGPVFRHFRLSFAVILIPLHVCALLFADEAAPTPVNDAVIFSALIALPLAALYTFVMYPIVELSTMRFATISWTAKATVAGFGFFMAVVSAVLFGAAWVDVRDDIGLRPTRS